MPKHQSSVGAIHVSYARNQYTPQLVARDVALNLMTHSKMSQLDMLFTETMFMTTGLNDSRIFGMLWVRPLVPEVDGGLANSSIHIRK